MVRPLRPLQKMERHETGHSMQMALPALPHMLKMGLRAEGNLGYALSFDPYAFIGKKNPSKEEEERRLDALVDQVEREAIMNEPSLPPPGSEARKIIDLNHERMVRGLIGAARR